MTNQDRHTTNETTSVMRSPDWSDTLERWLNDWPRPRLLSDLRRNLGDTFDAMRIEEFTEGNQVVVRAEMPGIDPDRDVQITVADHTLRLRAERRHESVRDDDGTYRSEFRYGVFARSVTLPVGVTEHDVKATYKDGVLEVRIPVDRAEAEARTIPVQRM